MKPINLLILSIAVLLFSPKFANGQWVQNEFRSNTVWSLAVIGPNLFAGVYSGGVSLSTNNGVNWAWTNSGFDYDVRCLAVSGTKLIAGTYGDGVFLSTNNGTNWIASNTFLPGVLALAISGTNLFAGTIDGGVFLSTNNGLSWAAVNTGLTNKNILSLAVSGTNLFAGTGDYGRQTGDGVFLSTNNGASWKAVGFPGDMVNVLAVSGKNIFASTNYNGVFRSTDSGSSWTKANTGMRLSYPTVFSFAVSGTNLFAGTQGSVFLSKDSGTSWTEINAGLLYDVGVGSLTVCGMNLIAGTGGYGVWRRPLSEMVTSSVSHDELPATFTLNQNYPNPFNPSTDISFVLASRGIVTLEVFDMLGRHIQTLVNQARDAGSQSARFDAGNLPSGIYTVRLTANGGRREMKMILSK